MTGPRYVALVLKVNDPMASKHGLDLSTAVWDLARTCEAIDNDDLTITRAIEISPEMATRGW